MTTIERNYRTRPHTARFLQTFHTDIGSNGRNYRDEAPGTRESRCLECEGFHPGGASCAPTGEDLLDSIPTEHVADLRSPAQRDLMERLVREITAMDAETGSKARAYTDGMTEHGKWTPGYEGTASAWITRMISKANGMKAAAPAPAVTVADGRYAVEEGGTLRFFKVKNGGRPGFVFLDVQASDDWHAVRSVPRIRAIVALIAQDPKAAMIRYGVELGECGKCGRTLTSEYRKLGLGPICIDK